MSLLWTIYSTAVETRMRSKCAKVAFCCMGTTACSSTQRYAGVFSAANKSACAQSWPVCSAHDRMPSAVSVDARVANIRLPKSGCDRSGAHRRGIQPQSWRWRGDLPSLLSVIRSHGGQKLTNRSSVVSAHKLHAAAGSLCKDTGASLSSAPTRLLLRAPPSCRAAQTYPAPTGARRVCRPKTCPRRSSP
jgi:hypothetical protein